MQHISLLCNFLFPETLKLLDYSHEICMLNSTWLKMMTTMKMEWYGKSHKGCRISLYYTHFKLWHYLFTELVCIGIHFSVVQLVWNKIQLDRQTVLSNTVQINLRTGFPFRVYIQVRRCVVFTWLKLGEK
jgi:hypothetical protein